MTYDHWKSTNPADEFLGPPPEPEWSECEGERDCERKMQAWKDATAEPESEPDEASVILGALNRLYAELDRKDNEIARLRIWNQRWRDSAKTMRQMLGIVCDFTAEAKDE